MLQSLKYVLGTLLPIGNKENRRVLVSLKYCEPLRLRYSGQGSVLSAKSSERFASVWPEIAASLHAPNGHNRALLPAARHRQDAGNHTFGSRQRASAQ